MQKREEINQIIKEINEYRDKEKLAFFVGAGVSRMSGYPTWAQLVMSMAKDIGYVFYNVNKEGNPVLSSEEFLKIPQMYYNEKGRDEYLKKVKSQLDVKKEPNNIHKFIMRMNPYHLLTTNYDDLLEQSANMFAINYSVINSDEKVSGTATQRYIIKVHGDFEKDKFVLKESDYLNYEQDYKLIDNIMKTIMATNLIVFIGYQLGDYNIKLILNWVQNVQKDSFIEPVFIYTDPEELKEIDIDYYKNRGLRIICANELCKNGDCYDRYKAVLEEMLEYGDKPADNTTQTAIDYLYRKLYLVDEIEYLRADDLIKIFKGITTDKTNIIQATDSNSAFAKFYEAYNTKEQLSPEYREKVEYIMRRLNHSGIIGCTTKNRTYFNTEEIQITNQAFLGNYTQIEANIVSYGDDIESLYNKAYDLCMLGRIEEAYHIYIELLNNCKEEQKWFYYFFSQVNLRYLSQLVRQIDAITKSLQGILYFERQLDLFEPKLLEDIGLLQAFDDLPAEIKQYSFLKKLNSSSYYMEDILKLYEENYNIMSDITKSNVTIFGISSYERSQLRMEDAVNFIYNNKFIFSVFSEHKSFIRTTMQTYLQGKAARMNIPLDENYSLKQEKFLIRFQEILLLIKNFKFSELKILTKEIDLFKFTLKDEDRKQFEEYIEYTISFWKDNFYGSIEGDRINMYILIKEEIKSMCYLGLYFIKDKKILDKYIQFFMKYMPEKELNYDERLWILNLIKINRTDGEKAIIRECESFLMEKVQLCIKNSNPMLLDYWREPLKKYSIWLNQEFPTFKSKALSKICSSQKFSELDKQFLEDLLPILTVKNLG